MQQINFKTENFIDATSQNYLIKIPSSFKIKRWRKSSIE